MEEDGEISLENLFTFLLISYSYIKFFHAYIIHKNCILKLLCSTSPDFSHFISIVNYKFKSPLKCLIGRAKRAPHWGVQSRFLVIYIYLCVCLSWSKMRTQNYVAKHAHAQGQFGAVKTAQRHPYYSFRLYARAALAWTKKETFT